MLRSELRGPRATQESGRDQEQGKGYSEPEVQLQKILSAPFFAYYQKLYQREKVKSTNSLFLRMR